MLCVMITRYHVGGGGRGRLLPKPVASAYILSRPRTQGMLTRPRTLDWLTRLKTMQDWFIALLFLIPVLVFIYDDSGPRSP
jgi:hypothetical protein